MRSAGLRMAAAALLIPALAAGCSLRPRSTATRGPSAEAGGRARPRSKRAPTPHRRSTSRPTDAASHLPRRSRPLAARAHEADVRQDRLVLTRLQWAREEPRARREPDLLRRTKNTLPDAIGMGGRAGGDLDGILTRCDVDVHNFWFADGPSRRATVILRRRGATVPRGCRAGRPQHLRPVRGEPDLVRLPRDRRQTITPPLPARLPSSSPYAASW